MGRCLECALPKTRKGKEIPGKDIPAKEGSSFCEPCQPTNGDPGVLRHGYFVPAQKKLAGDQEFAEEAKAIYDSFGLSYKFAGRYDGVSIFQRLNGTIVKRLSLEDFFSTEFRVLVRDYPFV